MLKLYGYFRSSSSYRVRIALNLKGVDYEQTFVHLQKGEQFAEDYVALNPQQQLPSLITEQGDVMVQSPAILEWIEEAYPEPALLPSDAVGRQRVRAMAAVPGCDIHPIGNLRVLQYLRDEFDQEEEGVFAWARHWIELGFTGLEKLVADHPSTGRFCHGDTPTLADIYLVPQVFNGQRFKADMNKFPTLQRIYEACQEMDAFDKAFPLNQPDAPA